MTRPQAAGQSADERFRRCRRRARACAFQALYELDVHNAWREPGEHREYFWERVKSNGELPDDCRMADVRAFAETIVDTVLQHKDEIDRCIQEAAEHWTLDRMSMIDRNILRVAACELLYVTKVPPVTAVNEAIELAKEYGDKDSPRFVNGLLDKVYREREKTVE